MSKNIKQYLTRYAEPMINILGSFPRKHHYENCIVIPAYKERVDFVERFLCSSLSQQNSLVIIVINQPSYDDNEIPQQRLLDDIIALGQTCWSSQQCQLIKFKDHHCSILTVDCFNQPLRDREGVGLARKIGVDLAVYLYSVGVVKQTWIGSTDADASLPNEYFTALNSLPNNTVAACFNFCHESDEIEIEQATQLYESALRYYVAGLSYAGSNYAYFTIGSVIAFTVDSYVSVRGFPKRNAGEDFYLLNKLAKQGQVAWLKNIKVSLQARLSDRVPFGTGPAVNEIIRNAEKGHSYHYYHPEIFEQLKALMAAFNDLPKFRYFYNEWLNKLSTPNQSCLQSMDFESFIIKQKQVSDAQLLKQLHVWFDAFKTLKYVHYLRDNYFENIPLLQAINQAKFNIDTTKATLD